MTGLGKCKCVFGCWERTWTGLKSSPEIAARAYYLAKGLIQGKEKNQTNPFFLDKVVINAIVQEDFNPALPWVLKYNITRKMVTGDVRAYIDDLRSVRWRLEHAWNT